MLGMTTTSLKPMYWYRCEYARKEIGAYLESSGLKHLPLEKEDGITYYHYFGSDVLHAAYRHLKSKDGGKTRILDAGSGIGGCSRYWKKVLDTSSELVAVELLEDLDSLGKELTEAAGLTSSVKHFQGDLLQLTPDDIGGPVDGVLSLLVFLHISDKTSLFASLARIMKPDASLFAMDFYLRKQPSDEEAKLLKEVVCVPWLPTLEQYREALRSSGFRDIEFEEKTPQMEEYTAKRAETYKRCANEKIQIHGSQAVEAFQTFYDTVARLFSSGSLGGVYVTAVRE